MISYMCRETCSLCCGVVLFLGVAYLLYVLFILGYYSEFGQDLRYSFSKNISTVFGVIRSRF